MLLNPNYPEAEPHRREVETAANALGRPAGQLGAVLMRVEVTKADDMNGAFDAIRDRDAVLVQWDFLLISLRKHIAELALHHQEAADRQAQRRLDFMTRVPDEDRFALKPKVRIRIFESACPLEMGWPSPSKSLLKIPRPS